MDPAIVDLRGEENPGHVGTGFADGGERGGVVGTQRPERALDLTAGGHGHRRLA